MMYTAKHGLLFSAKETISIGINRKCFLIFLPVPFHIHLFCIVTQADFVACALINEHRRGVKRLVE